MADKKISELTAITGANTADDDVFVIVDTSAGETKKITLAELEAAIARGDIRWGDNEKAIFGAGSDLQIYHDGSTNASYIAETGTGHLYVRGTNLWLQNGAVTKTYATFTDGGSADFYYNDALKLATTSTGIDVTGTATMDGLTVDGNVGIGTSSPSGVLAVTDGSNGLIVGQSLDNFYAATSHRFYAPAYATEHMRIDSSGNVGIGVDPETNKFRVTQSGVTQLILGYQGTSTNYYDADTHILRAGGGSEHMRIDSSGTLVLAATSPGIQFGGVGTPTAPVTSKTLDDYEEGTWTPTAVWGSGSAATITGDTYTGGYTKVGSQVHAFARITYTSKSGGSGDVYFNNLPFAIDTSVIDPVGAYVATAHNVNLGATKRYAGTTAFSVLVQPSQGSAWRWTTIGDFPASGGDIYMTFSYRAA